MTTTPVFLNGRDELAPLGYTDYHDYGQAAFGNVNNIVRKTGEAPQPTLQWGTCRDGLQQIENARLLPGFYFTHAANNALDTAAFLLRIETTLNLHPVSVYRLTSAPHVMWVRPSHWWLSTFMRKSFYSMMLRCAYNYRVNRTILLPSDNFTDALWSIDYTRHTRPAVEKFLRGYTIYEFAPRDHCDGWFRQFSVAVNTSTYPVTYEPAGNVANIRRLRPGMELVSKRAYEKWLQRGGRSGYDKDDWYNAEQELLREAS